MIFGIGLPRTGTTSLHHALELAGVASAPSSLPLLDRPNHPILRRYEAFTDNPIPFMYRDLDARFPGSKFVLTTRPLGDWLASMEWLFDEGLARLDRRQRRAGRRVHRHVYRLRHFNAARLTAVYREHHDGVDEWFEARAGDLLRLDLTEHPDPWQPLCEFLELERPDADFPSSNRRNDKLPEASIRR